MIIAQTQFFSWELKSVWRIFFALETRQRQRTPSSDLVCPHRLTVHDQVQSSGEEREREREKTFDEECKMTAEVMLVVKSLYQFINNLLEFIALFNVEPFFADNKTNKQKTTTLYSFTSVVTNFIVRYLTLNVSLQNNKPQSTPSMFLLTRNCRR